MDTSKYITVKQIDSFLKGKGRTLWIYGRRDTGKTYFVKDLAARIAGSTYYNCLEEDAMEAVLKEADSSPLIILDNYDRAYGTRGKNLKLLLSIQKKIKETGKNLIIVSRKRIAMNPLFERVDLGWNDNTYIEFQNISDEKCRRLFRGYSRKDNTKCSVFHDGNPYVLSFLSPDKTLKENIVTLLENRDVMRSHILKDIPDDIKEDSCKVLMVLSDYEYKASSLSKRTGLSEDRVDEIIRHLVSMDYIKRETQFDFGRNRVVDSDRYSFIDLWIMAFFKFIYLFNAAIENAEEFYDRNLEEKLTEYSKCIVHIVISEEKNEAVDVTVHKKKRGEEVFLPAYVLHPSCVGKVNEITICDYNISDRPYSKESFDSFLNKVSLVNPCSVKVNTEIHSISGFESFDKPENCSLFDYHGEWEKSYE